jgi:predicted Zn-dependent protease with MMP-like domain
MDFESFSRLAHERFVTIPREFLEGVDGLTVRFETLPHPTLSSVFTLGQCLTEAYPSEWTGPETLRSVVVLYYGSFRALAAEDPAFDWGEQIWETLTHELRHHLEILARDDALEGVDYAMEEAFHRGEGLEFDPFYYRSGFEVAPGVFQVEYDFFIEQSWTQREFGGVELLEFSWHGATYRVLRPERLGDMHYIWIHGLEVGPGSLQLVLLRRRDWRERLTGWSREFPAELLESGLEVMP